MKKNRTNVLSRFPLAGIALLTAMLFYVSGAALLVHIQLEHAHGQVIASNTGCDDQHNTPGHGPARTPDTPTKQHCQLCDMLAGTTQPLAVVTPAQTILFADTSAFVFTPDENPATCLSAPDISRRGPPSLG